MSNFVSVFQSKVFAKDHKPFLYEVGQKVRIPKRVINNFQVPEYWAGSVAQILSRRHVNSSTSHRHLYRVKLLHGDKICEFFEEDLDRRFVRKNLDKLPA